MNSENSGNDRFHLLLIEDNVADVVLIEEALREHEVAVDMEVLTDGEAAYDYWTRFSDSAMNACPDLVLLDLNLPKRGGLEVLQRIRQTPACVELKVMVMSSSANPKDMQQASELGIYHYFHKPSNFDEFLELGRIIKSVQSKPQTAHG